MWHLDGKTNVAQQLGLFSSWQDIETSTMKFILILGLVLLGEVAFSAKHKSGGNCGFLAGSYDGFFSEQGPECK